MRSWVCPRPPSRPGRSRIRSGTVPGAHSHPGRRPGSPAVVRHGRRTASARDARPGCPSRPTGRADRRGPGRRRRARSSSTAQPWRCAAAKGASRGIALAGSRRPGVLRLAAAEGGRRWNARQLLPEPSRSRPARCWSEARATTPAGWPPDGCVWIVLRSLKKMCRVMFPVHERGDYVSGVTPEGCPV